MYQILIVDDEILVRTNIKMMIDWEHSDFCLCGEASNGSDALPILREKQPEIVLTDMKMPIMDGLALSEAIARGFPGTALIALSNYDDFEYVRGALKNGAVDYILKHNLNADVIAEALLKARNLCQRSRRGAALPEAGNNIAALKKEFLIQLLTGFYSDGQTIRSHMQMLEIGFGPENIVPVLMSVSSDTVTNQRLKDRDLFEYGIVNITKEILSDVGNGEICAISNGTFCLLLSFEGIRSENKIENRIDSVLRRIQLSLKQFFSVDANFCVGRLCVDITGVPKDYESIETYVNGGFIFSRDSIVRPYHNSTMARKLTGLSTAQEHALVSAVERHDSGAAASTVEAVFSEIECENLDMASAQIIFTDLLGIIGALCKRYGIARASVFSDENSVAAFLASYDFKKIRFHFLELFSRIIENMPEAAEEHFSHYVGAAIALIRKNYESDISQQSIADKIGISSSYLSTLFKSETSVGFSEYITNFRLKKAAGLFLAGETDIRSAARRCGFYDYYYFFKVFKKKYGITPNEFIRQQGKR